MSFEDKIQAILSTANRRSSGVQLEVIEETITNLVERLRTKGVPVNLEKTNQLLDTWCITVDGFTFELMGVALIDLATTRGQDLIETVEEEFIESLEDKAKTYPHS